MNEFVLPKLKGDKPTAENIIYFSCNKDYYHKYGIPLINSILNTVDFISIHCHLILKSETINLLKNSRVSYTYEVIDENFLKSIPINTRREEGKEIWGTDNILEVIEKTYYASSRFMRLTELFNETQHIFQIDCDSLMQNPIKEEEFRTLTKEVRLMPKPKDTNVIIASSICLGTGLVGEKFRNLFSYKMINAFNKGAYWFIDQDVLKEVSNEVTWKHLPFTMNSWKISKDAVFVTGKGTRKEKNKFKALLEQWTDI